MEVVAEVNSWEDVFRTSKIEEIRQLSAKLKRQSSTHALEVQTLVGEKHEEVIVLANSIEHLLHDIVDQESELKKLTAHRAANKFDVHNLNDNGDKAAANETIQGRLVALADHFFAQRRLSYVARVLYVAKHISVEASNDLKARDSRLQRLVDVWIKNGDGVTQDIYHATLISRQISPEELIKQLIQERKEATQIELDENRLAQAVSKTDSALFVLSQLTADLCRVRLSRRRMAESPELANISDLAGQLQAFPDSCYAPSDDAIPERVDLSILGVVDSFNSALTRVFSGATSPKTAAAEYELIMSRTRDSVDPAQLAEILTAATNAFCNSFKKLIVDTTESLDSKHIDAWKQQVCEAQEELKRLKSRSIKQATIVDPKLGKQLSVFVDEISELVSTTALKTYQKVRGKLVKNSNELALAEVIRIVRELDVNFKATGGTPEPAPLDTYEQLVKEMVSNWEPVAGADSDDPRGCLYVFCRLMDNTLPPELWTSEVVTRVRSQVLGRIEAKQADLLPQSKALLEGGGNNEDDQSRLLLRPLAV